MFRNTLYKLMSSKGICEDDIYKLLSSHILTDEEIFEISRFIDSNQNTNVFFSRYIGDIEIKLKLFDIEIDYMILSKDKKIIASMGVNFFDESLIVEFSDIKLDIGLDLMDYKNKNTKNVLYMRMHVLNEILTRYYTKLLYSIYLERRI